KDMEAFHPEAGAGKRTAEQQDDHLLEQRCAHCVRPHFAAEKFPYRRTQSWTDLRLRSKFFNDRRTQFSTEIGRLPIGRPEKSANKIYLGLGRIAGNELVDLVLLFDHVHGAYRLEVLRPVLVARYLDGKRTIRRDDNKRVRFKIDRIPAPNDHPPIP